jgi:4-hydroxythreonine-4-phosphate dehydrogenase
VTATTPLALTPGEPAGIGPDITLRMLSTQSVPGVVVVCDREMLAARAAQLGLPVRLVDESRWEEGGLGVIPVHHVGVAHSVQAGTLDVANSAYVLKTLDEAVDGIADGRYAGLVTGPVHKGIINEAGVPFSGHTEYLAERTNGDPVMMLVAPGLRVALATTHVPLAEVSKTLNGPLVERVVRILDTDLRSRFGIEHPRILVCGVNPHAGEDGHIGSEEVDWLNNTVASLRASGINLDGPKPADTAFVPSHRANADVVLAMYHDQGLPVLKALGFGDAVNVTLGLSIIRTSVDHGTALDLAGRDGADASSLLAATRLAGELVQAARESSARADRR